MPAAADGRAASQPSLQVSFAADAVVRLRDERLVKLGDRDPGALAAVLDRRDVVDIRPAITADAAAADATRRALLRAGKRGVPDINRHYTITVRSRRDRAELLAALRRLPVVDVAGPAPRPLPPPASPSFTGQQPYAGVAPGGVGAPSIAARPGGSGERVRIVDVEYSWNQAHEDVGPVTPIANGQPEDPFGDTDHGTAVLGILAGTANAFGVTGLAPAAEVGLANAYSGDAGYTPERAIELARQRLSPGDVLLLEQQALGVGGTGSQPDAYVPLEYLPPVYDAIRLATQSGIIVVEAAGNGGVDLDQPVYGTSFPDGKPDSGAIVVGAGTGDGVCSGLPPNSTMGFSTYGSRVDVQGWGECVTTAGFGDLFDGGADARYTGRFAGTSSASAVVAGAAALFSSVFEAENGRAPDPRYVRSRLAGTGTPPSGLGGAIGPLPDLAAALTGYDGTPPTVTLTNRPAVRTNDRTPTLSFTASEAASYECRQPGDAGFGPCVSPLELAPLADGEHSVDVRATDAAFNQGPPATATFTVDGLAPRVSLGPGSPDHTNDATPTFAFAADEPDATFACRVGAAEFTACASPYTAPPLSDGAQVFEVRATDPAGNSGPAVSRSFTVDRVAPRVLVDDGPGATTDDRTPTFTFSVEGAAPPACRVGTARDPGTFAPCTSPHTTVPLADGAYVFEVSAVDAAGNSGSAARAFRVAAADPPLPPPANTPSEPGPEPAPTLAGADARARVSRRGTVRLSAPLIACPAAPPACRVVTSARRVGRGRVRLGRASSTISPGASALPRFGLRRSARRALARRGRLAAAVTVTVTHDGRATTRSLRVLLRLAGR